ncbi:MAG: NADH-dependent [FeFe] hydrogenase, group A6 [Clostridia bacterium]|nr:NADH-dependent [FeFe] hydrogenase, group A6 [Clostridiales bacterium]MDD7165500.1 NADH-dependent [FeFe] hydrogenase, group A6 [Clostridia bacterium]MDD7165507.1 NADH-dependent [FeFe] hydrogenase, group A6 [Clostridia bacterium]MDY2901240.1 NADH-dependent [FeFe] hydrogenase, group A6 [Christensenellaceae bacterium]
MAKVNIKIEGIPYEVEAGMTILEAAKACGYEIPSLCTFNHGECSRGSCRVCLVEATGARGLVASCVYPVNEGMEITISSPKAVEARRCSVELLLSNHNKNCQQCDKNGKCELLHVAQLVGARDNMYQGEKTPVTIDNLTPSVKRDTSKCILCGRCIERCKNAHGLSVLGFEKRGFQTIVAPAGNRSFANSPCILCGQCVTVCPTGALMEVSEIDKVDAAMKAGKYVVVQTAPAVRAALGEEFGYKIGTPVTGKMVAALRRLGFKKVFDTNFGADLTIVEEASELLHRVADKGVLPMITSCSPGWINYAEYYYGDLLPHLSSCKSPHEMFGAILKSYYAEKKGIIPEDMFVVSVMPCVAKKYEKDRPELAKDGIKDVDAVLTTRELAKLIKRSGIMFNRLPDEDFDYDIVGDYTGAGVIFGATGGVMEAALRTAAYKLDGKELKNVELKDVRGLAGIKEATYKLGGMEVKVAVASGMKNAKVLLDEIRAGKSPYHFIEIMGCPGGCVAGGGQPFVKPCFLPNEEDNILDTYREKRANALYSEDEGRPIRVSHKNPQIIELYEKFLGEPNSHKAHELLHTTYSAKEKFKD